MPFLIRSFIILSACGTLYADNLLHPGTPVLDRPTLTVLGVQLPITGDDNFNATVTMQYRVTGTQTWQSALPLFRVHPETVAGYTVAPQFGGSIFDLRPATSYDIQLNAVDPDGLNQTFNLTGTTRAVPSDPPVPNVRNVVDSSSLIAALNTAQPGDVITLANGYYPGPFQIYRGGTPTNPIVIRGQSQAGVVLDGLNCPACNVFEIYGPGYVHLENLTLQNATRGMRFQQPGSIGNVLRRVHIKNTTLGLGGQAGQLDFYIADNILEGVLHWPQTYLDDLGVYANNDGIAVMGNGWVVAHNQISGYGDAMKTEQDGLRGVDFYGNEILYSYDNGIELDGSEGNTRCFRNRFTNVFSPLSVQPIHGGPAYIFRNVVVNMVSEQLKFHALAVTPQEEPSGVLVYNNTFVAPPIPELSLQTPATSHYFAIENNIFLGPGTSNGVAGDWEGPIDHGTFDYNAYFPDGIFRFNNPALGGYFLQFSFAGLQVQGMEPHGFLAPGQLFASGLTPPTTYTVQLTPPDVTLAANAIVLDRALLLPNINDQYKGAGPDLGALELGCPKPTYGPRPVGTDESNEIVGCTAGVTIPVPVSVSVSPSTATVQAGGTQTFASTVSGSTNTAVTWSVSPAIGTITAGVYSVLATTPAQTVTVTATSVADPSKSASATVTITAAPAPISVSVTPGTATIQAGSSQGFTAAVSGSTNTAVTWSVSPAIGTVTAGVYSVLATTPAQTVTVTATSVADPSKSASATVTITAAPVPVSVSVLPATATVQAGNSQSFTATVSGSSNTAVNWTVSPAVGTITAAGSYSVVASTPAQTVTVTATSAADHTKSASATVNITAAPVPVSVSVSPATATVQAGNSQSFAATVSGSSNTGVTWSVSPAVGTITAAGSYSVLAGTPAQTVTVTATSSADHTKSASATVNITAAPVPVSVSVSPATVSVQAGSQQTFTAAVSGSSNTAVTWSVSPAVGSITGAGLYTIPANTPVQTVMVKAVSVADSTKSASATVNITAPAYPSLVIGPTNVTLKSGGIQQFTARVSNLANQAVTWSVNPKVGTISSTGLYIAPANVTGQFGVIVTATSVADPSLMAKVLIILSR